MLSPSRSCWVALLALMAACNGDGPTGGSPPETPPPPQVPGEPPLPCPVAEPPAAGTTYYIAFNEPGADNERCDGRSPVDRGGGRCPFKDFLSARTFRLLTDVAGVRLELRAGTYAIVNEGFTLRGTGRSESERVVLTAYQNEAVIIDGQNAVRELFRLDGAFTTIERLTLRNAGAHNVEVRGGQNHHIQCNRFEANLASDSLKGSGAANTVVRHNTFTQWDSQAIDLTGVVNWTIEDNLFHDSRAADANGIGAKAGARGVRIARNEFRNTGGLSFGGISDTHGASFEAFDLIAENNRFENLWNQAVKYYSCSNCVFRENDVIGAVGGIVLGGEKLEGPSGCRGGCGPTEGAVVHNNRFRDMRPGIEVGSPRDVFWGLNSSERSRLSSGENLYCVSSGGEAGFIIDDNLIRFDAWKRALGTDLTSAASPDGASACMGW